MKIQFLSFTDCPLAAPAKANLEAALAYCGIGGYEKIDILDSQVSEDLRAWGSPTILVDGCDVTGEHKGNSLCCRIYATPERVPSVQSIIACLTRA